MSIDWPLWLSVEASTIFKLSRKRNLSLVDTSVEQYLIQYLSGSTCGPCILICIGMHCAWTTHVGKGPFTRINLITEFSSNPVIDSSVMSGSQLSLSTLSSLAFP